MFTAIKALSSKYEFQQCSTPVLRIAMMQNCNCGMYERGACLTMEARSGKSPTENDQLGTRSGSPRAVMAYLGCCCHCCCLLSPSH